MKSIYIATMMVLSSFVAYSQNFFEATVKDSETKEPLIGASAVIPDIYKGGVTDTTGTVTIDNIPDSTYTIQFSYIGYKAKELTLTFPLPDSILIMVIFMDPDEEELEEVVITSTRSTRTIEDIPTRVEFIAGEELSEKGNMKPGDIRMLLNESTGIQTQQTSATSYNSSIRIQGLDGKYTQLLRDGLPLYSGFSGGLSLMQIAPLDLKQVEVIKGASSTLYGGGAIAGLVNLISKIPEEEREISVMANGTSALGADLSGFYSEKFDKTGTTVFASYNLGTPYDPADIGLTAIPKFNRFTLNPKLFFYPGEKDNLVFGLNFVNEKRVGGNMEYAMGNKLTTVYFEENKTNRASSQFEWKHQISDHSSFTAKNSFSYYNRATSVPDYVFSGRQLSSFSEVNFVTFSEKLEWVAGLNLWTDNFKQDKGNSLNYNQATYGSFIQNTWNISGNITLESGFRLDYTEDYGVFALPKVSLLYKAKDNLTFRVGGGMGYKTPTIFSEEAEKIHFMNLLPIDSQIGAEESLGGNFDVNHIIPLSEDIILTTNVMLFYTRVNNPLLLTWSGTWEAYFIQPVGYLDTKGVETNLKFSWNDLNLFLGYTYSDVNQYYNDIKDPMPLVAKHRLNNVLMYEKEDNFWIGVEAYFYSAQLLNDGLTGKHYWVLGIMSEKRFGEHFSHFINFENLLDTRQTGFDTIYTGSIDNPQFRDIYAPVDGFIINGGIKLKF